MFNAPEIIMNIKDIAEIYKINDSQEAELENAVEILENNIFLIRVITAVSLTERSRQGRKRGSLCLG